MVQFVVYRCEGALVGKIGVESIVASNAGKAEDVFEPGRVGLADVFGIGSCGGWQGVLGHEGLTDERVQLSPFIAKIESRHAIWSLPKKRNRGPQIRGIVRR